MKKLSLIILLLPAVCTAKTMYKCSSGNRVDYQFKPCTAGASQEIIEDQPPIEEKADAGGDFEVGIDLLSSCCLFHTSNMRCFVFAFRPALILACFRFAYKWIRQSTQHHPGVFDIDGRVIVAV